MLRNLLGHFTDLLVSLLRSRSTVFIVYLHPLFHSGTIENRCCSVGIKTGCGLEDWTVKVRLSNILTTCAEFRTVHSLDFALRQTIAIKIQRVLPGEDQCPSTGENVRGPIGKAVRGFWPSSSKE